MTLGEQLSRASDAILDLILTTPDIEQKKKLREQLTVILDVTGKLVEANVKKNTQEYIAATNRLNEVNDAIKEAISDLTKVADTIIKIAKVIEVLGKLAAML
jgi:flagellin-specific chaperone FliS